MYGIDIEDQQLMSTRSWRWLRTRIEELFSIPPTLVPAGDRMVTVHQTRIGFALDPPGRE